MSLNTIPSMEAKGEFFFTSNSPIAPFLRIFLYQPVLLFNGVERLNTDLAITIPSAKHQLLTSSVSRSSQIIAFVDDLDRCQENVSLQVLSAINLVLAECKINV
ncbi:hypothetical protein SUGI_0839260 [Cryptomeria japonica]|nr:hypothetical protein SUGI_0839260 [Cryptomeria japonica]